MGTERNKKPILGLIDALKSLLNEIPDGVEDLASLNHNERRRLKAEILEIIQRLEIFTRQIDPIKIPDDVFDPSDPIVIGWLIAKTLLERPRESLGGLPRFYGSGVYAIYYKGRFDAYESISGEEIPIYVGKVDPKDSGARTPEEQGDKLWNRLEKDHAKNIGKAINLKIEDFDCRYLVVRSAWQNTAENYLIDWFKPVWNNEMNICFGFGKHGDSSGTRNNTKSPWDTLHPGRKWAADHKVNPLAISDIIQQIKDHYAKFLPQIQSIIGIEKHNG